MAYTYNMKVPEELEEMGEHTIIIERIIKDVRLQ